MLNFQSRTLSTYIGGRVWRAKNAQGVGDEEQRYEDIEDDKVET